MVMSLHDLLCAPMIQGVITAAIHLGIFSQLEGRPRTVGDITERCNASEHKVLRLLEALVNLSLLHCDGDFYHNAQFSSVHLVEGKQHYVGDFLLLLEAEAVHWSALPAIITGGHAESGLSDDFFATQRATYIRAMNNFGAQGEADALRSVVSLPDCRRLLDVGGGSGIYSLALLEKHPAMQVTILDMAETLSITASCIENSPQAERITLRSGDMMTESFGENFDAILLSDILYREASAPYLLQKTRDALNPGGHVIIRGYYSGPNSDACLFGSLFTLKLLINAASLEVISFPQLRTLLHDTGFRVLHAKPLTTYSKLIIGRKEPTPTRKERRTRR